ncbi:MAG: stage II sporulation protein E [Cellulosilyticaceae bacterium]
MKNKMTNDEKPSKVGMKRVEIILCLLAFLMARIGVGEIYYTVGVAYVGTLFFNKAIRKWSWLFATCGIISLTSFRVETIKYIFMFMLVAVIREYMVSVGNKLTIKNQMAVVSISILVVDVIASLIQGFSWYSLAMTSFEAVVGAGCCLILFYGVEVLKEERTTPLTTREATSMIFIFACILGGFVDFFIKMPVVKEVYFKDILTFIVMIGVIYLGGINVGVTISVVIGSVLAMIGYISPELIGVYGLAAILGGLFLPLGRIGTIIGIGIGQVLGFIVFNDYQMNESLIAAYIGASIISLLIPKHYFGMAHWFPEKNTEVKEKEHLLRVQHIMTDRLKHVVSGFEKLGKSFQKLQERNADYTPKMINGLIEDTAEKLCESCSMRHFCWEQDLKNTYAQAYQMIGAIEKKGFISKGDIPEEFVKHCIHADNFAYVLSYKLDLLKQDLMWQNKFLENRELVAEELRAVAETLKDLIHDVDKELYFDKEKEKYLKESIKAEGIKIKDVMVIENKGKAYCIDVHTPYCKQNTQVVSLLTKQIEKIVGYKVVLEKHECSEKGCHYKFGIRHMYHVTSGSAICAKGGVSGDVHTFMELQDNQYLLAVADGMGSGVLAYEESAAAMEMLEDFMESGFRRDLAIRMINAALILKSDEEVFSTMDITLIDQQTGIAEFLKAGASTSFILRKGEVLTVRTSTLPVGILKDVDVESKKIQLESGDMIIMVTDGILQTPEDVLGKEETFKHFIKEVDVGDPQYMAAYLMEKSKALLGVKERDDMTIVVAKIWQDPMEELGIAK